MLTKSIKYKMPDFLENIVTHEHYLKWLHRKAMSHIKRDRSRGNSSSSNEEYKIAIHNAVIESGGVDAYTGEELDWTLIGKYDNDESKNLKREYKKSFALLPSIDHVNDGLGAADFKICSWRTNDSKHDLTHIEFYELCLKVVEEYKQNK